MFYISNDYIVLNNNTKINLFFFFYLNSLRKLSTKFKFSFQYSINALLLLPYYELIENDIAANYLKIYIFYSSDVIFLYFINSSVNTYLNNFLFPNLYN